MDIGPALDLIQMLSQVSGEPANYKKGDALFVHISGVYNVSRAHRLIEESPGAFGPIELPIDKKLRDGLESFILLDAYRLFAMDDRARDTPAIALMLPPPDEGDIPPMLLIDGHHRLIRRFDDGFRDIMTYVLPAAAIARITVYRTNIEVEIDSDGFYKAKK